MYSSHATHIITCAKLLVLPYSISLPGPVYSRRRQCSVYLAEIDKHDLDERSVVVVMDYEYASNTRSRGRNYGLFAQIPTRVLYKALLSCGKGVRSSLRICSIHLWPSWLLQSTTLLKASENFEKSVS